MPNRLCFLAVSHSNVVKTPDPSLFSRKAKEEITREREGEEVMDFCGDLLLSAAISIVVALIIVVISAIASLDLDHRRHVEKFDSPGDLGVEKLETSAVGAVLIEEAKWEEGSGKKLESGSDLIGEICEDDVNADIGDVGVVRFDRIEGLEERIEGLEEVGASEVGLMEKAEEKGFELVEGVERGGDGSEKKLFEEEEVDVGFLIDEEDEWEGVERSEVEKRFAVANEYAGSADGSVELSKLGIDVQMRLYGLRKIATEGPCYETQPMVFKASSRAKWQAWQRVGDMNPEVAMEQYINLLSESIPGWMGTTAMGDGNKDEGDDSLMARISATGKRGATSPSYNQLGIHTDRKQEDNSYIGEYGATAGSEYSEHGLPKHLFDLVSPTTVKYLNLLW